MIHRQSSHRTMAGEGICMRTQPLIDCICLSSQSSSLPVHILSSGRAHLTTFLVQVQQSEEANAKY